MHVCGVSVRSLTYRTQMSGKLVVAPATLCMLTANSATADRQVKRTGVVSVSNSAGGGLDDDTDDF